MVWKIFFQFPTVSTLGLQGVFFNSVSLSDRIYLGHMWTGRYCLKKVDTIVSADLSGIGKVSGQPMR